MKADGTERAMARGLMQEKYVSWYSDIKFRRGYLDRKRSEVVCMNRKSCCTSLLIFDWAFITRSWHGLSTNVGKRQVSSLALAARSPGLVQPCLLWIRCFCALGCGSRGTGGTAETDSEQVKAWGVFQMALQSTMNKKGGRECWRHCILYGMVGGGLSKLPFKQRKTSTGGRGTASANALR